MAYTPHYLLQFGGYLGSAVTEIWSSGIRLWSENFTGFDEVGYLTGVGKDALAAWWLRPGSKIGGHAKLAWAKFNFIAEDGKYESTGVTNEYNWPAAISGGAAATSTLPYQASIVLSWGSNEAARGPASKGRIYQPAPAAVTIQAGTGLFSAAEALACATSGAELINTLDITSATTPVRPAIMSNIGGAHHQIDFVSVDNRIDIQRRRANALVGARSTVNVTY